MLERVFDREPRLANAAKTRERNRGARGERVVQLAEVVVTAHEQRPERSEGQVARLACGGGRGRFHQRVDDRRGENLRNEIVGAGERRARIAVDRFEALQMFRLRRARNVRRGVGPAAIGAWRRRDDQQVFVETDGEPRLPLGIGEARQGLHASDPSSASLVSEEQGLAASTSHRRCSASRVEPVMSPAK